MDCLTTITDGPWHLPTQPRSLDCFPRDGGNASRLGMRWSVLARLVCTTVQSVHTHFRQDSIPIPTPYIHPTWYLPLCGRGQRHQRETDATFPESPSPSIASPPPTVCSSSHVLPRPTTSWQTCMHSAICLFQMGSATCTLIVRLLRGTLDAYLTKPSNMCALSEPMSPHIDSRLLPRWSNPGSTGRQGGYLISHTRRCYGAWTGENRERGR
jgi:hypothetical protein